MLLASWLACWLAGWRNLVAEVAGCPGMLELDVVAICYFVGGSKLQRCPLVGWLADRLADCLAGCMARPGCLLAVAWDSWLPQ